MSRKRRQRLDIEAEQRDKMRSDVAAGRRNISITRSISKRAAEYRRRKNRRNAPQKTEQI